MALSSYSSYLAARKALLKHFCTLPYLNAQMLTILFKEEADTVSCSRDDTNYSFFASQRHNVISVVVKKLGEETIEFEIPSKEIRKIEPLPH